MLVCHIEYLIKLGAIQDMTVRVKQKNSKAIGKAHSEMVKRASKEVAVGFPMGQAQAYPDGTSVALVASSHVYGLGVPKRDFMGFAKDEITNKTAPMIAKALKSGNKDSLYEAAGLTAQAAIQNAIVALDEPPNSPKTIAQKGSANPLIDTGHMVQSVTYIVREKTK